MPVKSPVLQINRASYSGQAALSMVILIGGIITLVAVILAFFAVSFLGTGFSYRHTQRASLVATAGAQDGVMQLVRNRSFSSGGYSVPVDTESTTVTVTQGTPVTNQATILSVATVLTYTRRIQVVVDVNPNNGQITVLSWQELLI